MAASGEIAEKPSHEGVPAWVWFLGLVLTEYLGLSYAFDAQDLLNPAGWGRSLSEIGGVLPLALVMIAATVVVGGHRAAEALQLLSRVSTSRRLAVGWLGAHALLYSSISILAHHISTHRGESESMRWLLLFWCVLVLFVGASAALAFWNFRTLAMVLGRLRSVLYVGAGVGVLAWVAGTVVRLVETPLADWTLELVHASLTLMTVDPVASVSEKLVGTERFYVTIAPVCSGVEGMGLMAVFVSAFLILRRKHLKWPQALWLLPVSLVAIWALNVVRITLLVLVGTWLSQEVAVGGFHSKAGWVFFTLCAWGAVAWAEKSSRLQATALTVPSNEGSPTAGMSASREGFRDGAAASYLSPLLGVLGVSLLSGLVSAGMDWLYPARVVVAVGLLWVFREAYRPWTFRVSPWSVAIGVALAIVWIFVTRHSAEASTSALGQQLSEMASVWAGLWLAFRIFGTAVTVPLIEEPAFRGLLMRRLSQVDFDQLPYRKASWFGLIASSVAFGFLHSQMLLGIFAGLVFGALARWKDRLSDAVAAHSVTNLTLVIYVFVSRDWALLG